MAPTNRPRFPRLLFGGLLLACLAVGCGPAAGPPVEETHPAPVKVVEAQTVTLGEWTELLGATQPLPDRAGRVTAAVEGRVVAVLGDGNGTRVAEGDRVEAGQVIVRLDDRVVRANRDKAAAVLAESDEHAKQAQYAVDLADIEVKRLEELTRTASTAAPLPAVSRIELEKARILFKEAQSKQKAVEAQHTGIKAELRALDAQLDFHTLRAPVAGRLGLVQVAPGQTLAIGTAVAEVIDLDEIDVLCFVPPHSARRLTAGQAARVEGPNAVPGKVVFVAEQAQPETGNFAAKVRFPNGEMGLRANAVLRVHVLTQPEQERLTIPETALLEDQEPPAVVVVEDVKTEKNAEGHEEKVGKAKKLRAILGVRDRARHLVEIVRLEDPEKGEPVAAHDLLFVTEGGHGLHDDDEVKVEEEEKH